MNRYQIYIRIQLNSLYSRISHVTNLGSKISEVFPPLLLQLFMLFNVLSLRKDSDFVHIYSIRFYLSNRFLSFPVDVLQILGLWIIGFSFWDSYGKKTPLHLVLFLSMIKFDQLISHQRKIHMNIIVSMYLINESDLVRHWKTYNYLQFYSYNDDITTWTKLIHVF